MSLRPVCAAALFAWLCATSASAVSVTVATSADPADGWRSIAPVGDLSGQPLSTVGLDWEADNTGWNTSLGFDDSDAAGWLVPVTRGMARYGSTANHSIWADDPRRAGDQDGVATHIGVREKAHDSFGVDEPFSLLLRIDPAVPEPATPVLLLAAIVGASLLARWRDLQEGRRDRTRRAPRGSPRRGACRPTPASAS